MSDESEYATLEEYLTDFSEVVETALAVNEVGSRAPRAYFLADYVSKVKKRKVVFFLTRGRPETASELIQITYILPVEEGAASVFGGDGSHVLPPDGAPTFFHQDIPAGMTAVELMAQQAAHHNLAPWTAEIDRVQPLGEAEVDPKKGMAIRNLVRFWKRIRPRMFRALYAGEVRMRRTASNKTATASSSHRSSTRRNTTASEPRRLRTSQKRKTTDPR